MINWQPKQAGFFERLALLFIKEQKHVSLEQTPLSVCSVCDEIFQPSDDMDFVCRDCQSLVRCDCGSDDVHMDWGVEPDGDFSYYWIIECSCGRTMKSRLHSIKDINIVAKELYKRWLTQTASQHLAKGE